MQNPLVWLGLSLLLVAICLAAVLLVALPVMQELARAARSAEKLMDMLARELPPTLQSLRSTGEEIAQLSDHVNEGVRSASRVVKQVDEGIETVRHQAETASRSSLSLVAGLRQAWQVFWQPDAVRPLAAEEPWAESSLSGPSLSGPSALGPSAPGPSLAQSTQAETPISGQVLASSSPALTEAQETLAVLEAERCQTQRLLEQLPAGSEASPRGESEGSGAGAEGTGAIAASTPAAETCSSSESAESAPGKSPGGSSRPLAEEA